MKRVSIIFLTFILMITSFYAVSNADETQTTETTEVTENVESIESTDTIITTYGKIIEAGEIKQVSSGTMIDEVQEVVVEITEGDYIGEEFTTDYVLSYDIEGKILAYELKVGDKVSVQIEEDSKGETTATVLDVVRVNYIVGLFVIFLVSILLIGGKKGIKTIVALLFSIVIMYLIVIKGIFNGGNAIRNSIITSALIILATFIIIGNGINKKILTAALGTFGGILVAGIVAIIFNKLAKMTGVSEDAIQLSVNMLSVELNFRHLLFAGIVISTLGACMNVGMSIATKLDEIKMKNPDITWKELFVEGMNIGKDIIEKTANILVFAYFGSSITFILLFMACDMNMIEILNKEIIAKQIISALAGSMGVVYTVPITSFVYSIFNRDKVIYRKTSDNKLNGKRSLKI